MKQSLCSLFIMLLVLAAAGCSNRKETKTVVAAGEFSADSTIGSLQRMNTYDFSDTITLDKHLYRYHIHREAVDSLPQVKDEEGNTYADNVYTLSIERNGKSFFNKKFAKRNFMHLLSDELRKGGLLDGMMYDSTLPGLNFAVSVSLPQSDMLEPLLLYIDDNGAMSIKRDTRVDMEQDDDADNDI